jgi:hypothetical protein
MKAALNNLSKQNPLLLAAGAALLVWVVYSLARKTVTDVAKGAGGVFTGNNAVTRDTVYEGAGLGGTFGAAADSISGGLLSKFGEWVGGVFAPGSAGESSYYTVYFPDGTRHAVPASTVSKTGVFSYDDRRYVLGRQDGKNVARVAP